MQINYIDFYNAVFGIYPTRGEGGMEAVRAQKMKKKFINLLEHESEQVRIQKNA